MFPHLNLDKDDSIPCSAKDHGQGYVLLRTCQKTAKPAMKAETNVILKYWEEMGWPNRDTWH